MVREGELGDGEDETWWGIGEDMSLGWFTSKKERRSSENI
jgi:hypothetical protein